MKKRLIIGMITSLFLFMGMSQNALGQAMQINIKLMTGETITLDVNAADIIQVVKQRIEDKTNIKVNMQRLIFDGKQLEDDKTLADYGIKDDDNIHLALELRGG